MFLKEQWTLLLLLLLLLLLIDTNFSTSQFTPVLNFFYIVSLFVYNVFQVATTLLNAQVHTS